jgi:hypothetical protein
VRPFTFIEAIEDYRLELSVDANYARFDKIRIMKSKSRLLDFKPKFWME